jgi:hypothetical protein
MKYEHIGWCKEGTADKVWGIICLNYGNIPYDPTKGGIAYYNPEKGGPYLDQGKFVTFWGRRGKKLQTKIWEGTDWDAKEMFLKKQYKGYKSIDIGELNEVYPEFEKDLEKTAVWASLKF